MREQLGSVSCDFVSFQTLRQHCLEWLSEATPSLHHIVTLNPEMVVQASRDDAFLQATNAAELVVPDGAGLFWAREYLSSKEAKTPTHVLRLWTTPYERLTGRIVTHLLAALCQDTKQPLCILGASRQSAHQAALKLHQAYPKLTLHEIGGLTRAEAGAPETLDRIRETKASTLLVAFGAPYQTTWIEQHRSELPGVRIAVGVGGTIDQLSGIQVSAPTGWQKRNVEWVWRLLQDPSRLPRIWRATVSFPRLIQAQKRDRTTS